MLHTRRLSFLAPIGIGAALLASPLTVHAQVTPNAPIVVGGHNFEGQFDSNVAGSSAAGAIGPTHYIQLVNAKAAIYDRASNAVIGTGTLMELVGLPEDDGYTRRHAYYPRIFWDAGTQRFYFAIGYSATYGSDPESYWYTAVGYSRTATPTNFTTDWCRQTVLGGGSLGIEDAEYGGPIGDSSWFLILGYHHYTAGASALALRKPASGTTCQTLSWTRKEGLGADDRGRPLWTPVPSNQIDGLGTGYLLLAGTPPQDKLWFVNVTRNPANGAAIFGPARPVSVPRYEAPPAAAQPIFSQLLGMADGNPRQAVQAINPRRGGNVHSFWTQHTIRSGNFSAIRWYEINPMPAKPVILRSGTIASNNASYLFNAAISPDRRVDGTTKAFGDSFVIHYNVTSPTNNVSPRIAAAASFRGGPLTFSMVKDAVGPYRDWSCKAGKQRCTWYGADAAPDPRPTTVGRGAAWGTNQFSGVVNPLPSTYNWRTQIFALQP